MLRLVADDLLQNDFASNMKLLQVGIFFTLFILKQNNPEKGRRQAAPTPAPAPDTKICPFELWKKWRFTLMNWTEFMVNTRQRLFLLAFLKDAVGAAFLRRLRLSAPAPQHCLPPSVLSFLQLYICVKFKENMHSWAQSLIRILIIVQHTCVPPRLL